MTVLGSSLQAYAVGLVALWLALALAAAVITALKGHWLLFITGFLTLGTVWLVGAMTLAAPDTWWATHFYDERKRSQAADRDRRPGPARITAATVGAILAALVVLLLFAAYPSPLLGVDGKSLEYSVAGPSVLPNHPCGKRPDGSWICHRWNDDLSSGGTNYRVTVDNVGCWTATPETGRPENGEDTLSGCITIRDHIRLVDRIFGDGGGGAAD